MPEKHTHAVVGAGLAGVTAALGLLAHGAEIGGKGADVTVHLFDAMSRDALFNRHALCDADAYPSGSAYGSRSVRLANASDAEQAETIRRSGDLYIKIHELALQHGIYDQLKAQGVMDIDEEPIVTYQHYSDGSNVIEFAAPGDSKPLKPLDPNVPCCGISLNINAFNQVAIALMEKLYPGKFIFHDGQAIAQATQAGDSVTLTTQSGTPYTVEDVIFSTGQYMKDAVEQHGLKSDVYAAPYIEFPVAAQVPVLKGDAIRGEEYSVAFEDGSVLKLTPKTITRNGPWIEDGVRKGDWMKVQFDEKISINTPGAIAEAPSLNRAAPIIAESIAENYGLALPDAQKNQAKGRWCPQIYAKDKAGEKVMLHTLPHEGNIHFFGPGNGHGAQLFGGEAENLAATIQHRTPRHLKDKTPEPAPVHHAHQEGVLEEAARFVG